MIAFLTGIIAEKGTESLVLDVGGIGYRVACPASLVAHAGQLGDTFTVHTHLSVRENDIALFGFETPAQLAFFLKLIGVSGVGPKVALSVLSSLSVETLIRSIMLEDIATLSSVPNVGKKTAQRIALDLKEYCTPLLNGAAPVAAPGALVDVEPAGALADAQAALLAMGFSAPEIDTALAGADATLDASGLVAAALRHMGS